MANGKQQRPSFFAEIRMKRNDPNYFNRTSVVELQKNVKRIIMDIKYGNILETDYVYFTSNNLLDACITYCYDNMIKAYLHKMAMMFYSNFYNKPGYSQYTLPESTEVMVNFGNLLMLDNQLYIVYDAFYRGFSDIRNGANIAQVILQLSNLNFDPRILN